MSKIKILLLEDNQLIAKNLKDILEKLNYEVVDICATAEEAFESLYLNYADLVISDVEIRGLVDGIDAAKIFQNLYNLPVIFITAYNDQNKINRSLELKNMLGYLVKPIKVDDLINLIEIAIKKFDLKNEEKILYLNNEYKFCFKTKTLYKNSMEIELTRNEKLLLMILLQNRDELVKYDLINESIWSNQIIPDGTRRQLIHRLRTKLSDFEFISKKGLGISLKK